MNTKLSQVQSYVPNRPTIYMSISYVLYIVFRYRNLVSCNFSQDLSLGNLSLHKKKQEPALQLKRVPVLAT